MEDKMVELVRFPNTTEAEMLANLLQSEGIQCYVRGAFVSQVFAGTAGDAKVELLDKDVARAQQIMRDNGYTVSDDPKEEMPEPDDLPDNVAEYEKSRKKLAKTMTIFIVLILIFLALLFFMKMFYT